MRPTALVVVNKDFHEDCGHCKVKLAGEDIHDVTIVGTEERDERNKLDQIEQLLEAC